MSSLCVPSVANGQSVAIDAVPLVTSDAFHSHVVERIKEGALLLALHGLEDNDRLMLTGCVGLPESASIELLRCILPTRYPALTPDCTPAHWFERELAEQWGVVPEGHPWLHPIRFQRTLRHGPDAWSRNPSDIDIGKRPFYQVQGDEVHEVAVGPVHAGVIEPGHFRFQCHGETVLHLEVSLGYQHRGVERLLVGAPGPRGLAVAETIAGDTSIGHALAYCHLVEALAGREAPPRAHAIRAIALELERMANHVGDLGALAGDVAYLPTASYCGRLRGDILNMTAQICGSRFGRGLVRPGGVKWDLDAETVAGLRDRLVATMKDVSQAVGLLWKTPSVMARFESMGVVSREVANQLGLVGPCARASGLESDVRADFPMGYYRFAQIPVSTSDTGDVLARALVRWLEVQRSAEFLGTCLGAIPQGPIYDEPGPLAPKHTSVALVEGWRGAICHLAQTDGEGRFVHYKVVDPSFHNWIGLAMALRNNPISEFPLCNKSFNLSYCGHDL